MRFREMSSVTNLNKYDVNAERRNKLNFPCLFTFVTLKRSSICDDKLGGYWKSLASLRKFKLLKL